MISTKDIVPHVVTEFLELAIHNILKLSEIYPDTIFVKKQKYNTIVYEAIHPHLKEYISNCMQAVFEIARENYLDKVVLCFLLHHEIIEKVVFEFSDLKNIINTDVYLLDTEKTFRSFFDKLPSLNEYLCPVSDLLTFALQIHTTESSGIAYMENPAYQSFPWMQINPKFGEIDCPSEIIPVETVDSEYEHIQIYIEKKK